jgi:site-specific recombinase XerD
MQKRKPLLITMQERNANKKIEDGKKEFLQYCKVRNLSHATIIFYEENIALFYDFVNQKGFIYLNQIGKILLKNLYYSCFCKEMDSSRWRYI